MNSPAEVAKNYIGIGKGKVNTPIAKMFLLGIMAGMFIAWAGLGSTVAGSTIECASVAKLVNALLFPGGLAMVLVAGSELFTGNCLLVIPFMEKEVSALGVLKNWVVVWIGNLVGSVFVAAISIFSHQASLFSSKVAVAQMSTAIGKCSMTFGDAFLKGVACNILVCIAVWMAFAAKDVAGKIIGLFFPICLFVVSGFEHSIANMYYIAVGVLAKGNATYLQAATDAGLDVTNLTWAKMFGANLLPVTLGNIVGGVLVGLVYWYVYLQGRKDA
ncbi:MAG: formate/nitrite transporter family protein [Eubacterium sp.]|nr:formate/nitrite transporter family protein [Eubacterium sp.]